MSAYHLNVFVHVLAAILWLGGMMFFALVGAPVLRKVEPAALRSRLFRRLGEQFRWVGWISIAVLLATGVGNLHFRGLLTAEVWTGLDFWTSTAYGRVLGAKLVLVAAMLVLQAFHDFVLGPRATRLEPGSPEARRSRRLASWLARINALLGLALIYVAVILVRGL